MELGCTGDTSGVDFRKSACFFISLEKYSI